MRHAVPRTAAIAAAALLLGAACADSSGSGDSGPIKVGLITSLTGNYQPLGTDGRKAAELAVQQINDAGGVDGRSLELVVEDDKSQPEQSVLAFNGMKDEVAAVIGSPFSNSALATIPAVDRAEIPYLSLTPADQQAEPVHPYVFVVPATAGTYAERLLQYYEAEGITEIAVGHDTKGSYSVAGYEAMKEKAAEYGVNVVADETFQTTTTDFSALLAHVRSSGAQALTAWGTGAPGVVLAKQYAAADLDTPLVLTGSQATELWLGPAGKAAEGVTVASAVGVVGGTLPDGELKKAITELDEPFREKHGYAAPQFAQDGYSGVKLLAAAIDEAGSSEPEEIRDALEGLTLTTPNGTYSYGPDDHTGLTREYISVNTVTDGAFEPTDWAAAQLEKVAKAAGS